jgi:hypothetical protein
VVVQGQAVLLPHPRPAHLAHQQQQQEVVVGRGRVLARVGSNRQTYLRGVGGRHHKVAPPMLLLLLLLLLVRPVPSSSGRRLGRSSGHSSSRVARGERSPDPLLPEAPGHPPAPLTHQTNSSSSSSRLVRAPRGLACPHLYALSPQQRQHLQQQ